MSKKVITPKKVEVTPIEQQESNQEFPTFVPTEVIIEPFNVPIDPPEVDTPKKVIEAEVIDIVDKWNEYHDVEELKKALNNLFIRFNTSPKVYEKRDYFELIKLLSRSLPILFNLPSDLAPIAYTGDVEDLVQHEYFILDCGTSTRNV